MEAHLGTAEEASADPVDHPVCHHSDHFSDHSDCPGSDPDSDRCSYRSDSGPDSAADSADPPASSWHIYNFPSPEDLPDFSKETVPRHPQHPANPAGQSPHHQGYNSSQQPTQSQAQTPLRHPASFSPVPYRPVDKAY